MARRSRLTRNYVKKSKRNLVLSIAGILAVLFLLVKYGIPLLSDASYMFSRVTNGSSSKQTTNTSADNNFIAPPNLDPPPNTTKNPKISVSGNALSGEKVAIYLNGVNQEVKDVSSDGSFDFNLTLSVGDNIIKAKAIKDKSESDFSDSVDIVYQNKEPNLSIDNPHDGDNLNGGNYVNVSGKAEPDDTVTVNDFQAIIDDQGNWSYNLTLANGGNDIKVVATDQAGNQTQKTIHVNYSQ